MQHCKKRPGETYRICVDAVILTRQTFCEQLLQSSLHSQHGRICHTLPQHTCTTNQVKCHQSNTYKHNEVTQPNCQLCHAHDSCNGIASRRVSHAQHAACTCYMEEANTNSFRPILTYLKTSLAANCLLLAAMLCPSAAPSRLHLKH